MIVVYSRLYMQAPNSIAKKSATLCERGLPVSLRLLTIPSPKVACKNTKWHLFGDLSV